MKVRYPALFVAVASFLGVTTSAAESTKVGVVDIQAAVMRTEDGMSMSATMKRYMDRHQNKLDRSQNALLQEERELKKQAPLLSRRALQRRYMHYQNRMLAAQKTYMQANQDLQKKQQGMMNPIMQKMIGSIRRAATRRGFDVVVDKGVAPYVRADLDLTDMVVQLYNSGGGAGDGGEKDE